MVGVSASVSPLHYKVQRFSPGTSSPGWSQRKGRKMVVVCGLSHHYFFAPNTVQKSDRVVVFKGVKCMCSVKKFAISHRQECEMVHV